MFPLKNNFKAKKSYGQNFLIDENTISQIITSINPEGKNILEIGPGKGALSKFLVNSADSFIAYELDKDACNFLIENKILKSEQIINQDFLTSNLEKYQGYEVVSNIPYNITSEIIFKLIDNRFFIKRAILMVQKEVALRLIAKPNQHEYSKLSITLQYVANVKKLFDVSKNEFSPMPKVDSSIVEIVFFQNKNDNFNKLKEFFKLCFLARRKKLLFALKTQYDYESIRKAYLNLNFKEEIRIQELDLETIVRLFNELEKAQND